MRACAEMMPRLQAEESLLEAERLGVGTATFSVDVRKRIIRGWQREQNAGEKPKAIPITKAALQGSGFAFQMVGRKKSDPPKVKS